MANELLHFGAYTIRVVGNGNLKGTLYGFDKIESKVISPLVMTPINRREPTKLTNFTTQRALLRLEVTEVNEWFKVNNFTIWTKPSWTQYPE